MRAAKRELRIFVAKELHAGTGEQSLGGIFGSRVNLVIAVAAPHSEGRAQAPDFFDALDQRIARAGDEISGDHGEIGAELVGHLHRAPNVATVHIAAQMNIADLDDLHALESWRQIRQRNLDVPHLVIQALRCKAIHGAEERSGAGDRGGGAEKVAA